MEHCDSIHTEHSSSGHRSRKCTRRHDHRAGCSRSAPPPVSAVPTEQATQTIETAKAESKKAAAGSDGKADEKKETPSA